MTRRRNLLHLSKLDEFAEWAAGKGWKRVETKGKGIFEVLRLRKRVAFASYETLSFYARDSGDHATSFGEGNNLVHQWIRERSSS